MLAAILPCPLSIYSPASSPPPEEDLLENMEVGWTVIRGTWIRAGILIQNGFLDPWKGRMARIPLTNEEVQELVRIRYESDELAAIRMLRECQSVSSGIYLRLGLTRVVISETLKELAECEKARETQVVLCGIICATRFKFYEEGDLLATECKKCGEEDSFDHLLGCAQMPPVPIPGDDMEPTVQFLVELAKKARGINAGLPVPRRPILAEDVSPDVEAPAEERLTEARGTE